MEPAVTSRHSASVLLKEDRTIKKHTVMELGFGSLLKVLCSKADIQKIGHLTLNTTFIEEERLNNNYEQPLCKF